MAQARSAWAINRRGKTRVRNLQYGPRNEVCKIFIISLYLEIKRAKNKVLDLAGRTVEYGQLTNRSARTI